MGKAQRRGTLGALLAVLILATGCGSNAGLGLVGGVPQGGAAYTPTMLSRNAQAAMMAEMTMLVGNAPANVVQGDSPLLGLVGGILPVLRQGGGGRALAGPVLQQVSRLRQFPDFEEPGTTEIDEDLGDGTRIQGTVTVTAAGDGVMLSADLWVTSAAGTRLHIRLGVPLGAPENTFVVNIEGRLVVDATVITVFVDLRAELNSVEAFRGRLQVALVVVDPQLGELLKLVDDLTLEGSFTGEQIGVTLTGEATFGVRPAWAEGLIWVRTRATFELAGSAEGITGGGVLTGLASNGYVIALRLGADGSMTGTVHDERGRQIATITGALGAGGQVTFTNGQDEPYQIGGDAVGFLVALLGLDLDNLPTDFLL
ncbi:MAG: hypothetical protein IT204_22200 [Fimbriimonadaceae bacterium]|nr:hypothetical protein [Fimbriimonadaceae bacterium]